MKRPTSKKATRAAAPFTQGQQVSLRGEGVGEIAELLFFDGESPPRPLRKGERANALKVRTETGSAVIPMDAPGGLRPVATPAEARRALELLLADVDRPPSGGDWDAWVERSREVLGQGDLQDAARFLGDLYAQKMPLSESLFTAVLTYERLVFGELGLVLGRTHDELEAEVRAAHPLSVSRGKPRQPRKSKKTKKKRAPRGR